MQHLLVSSAGTNLAVDFLPGSLGYDGMFFRPNPEVAARPYDAGNHVALDAAADVAAVRAGPVHPGITDDPAQQLKHLLATLVLRHGTACAISGRPRGAVRGHPG